VRLIDADGPFQPRTETTQFNDIACEARMIKEPFAADIIEIGRIGINRVARIDRHPLTVGAPDREQHDHQLRRIGRIKRNRLLVFEAVILERSGDLFGARLDFGKALFGAGVGINQRDAIGV
jgi:hypothetical protein